MADQKNTTEEADLNSCKELIEVIDKKVDGLSQVLGKFGLDIITKLGQNTTSYKVLKDKVEDLHGITLDIKSLLPQLNKVIEKQTHLETELDLIKTLIQKSLIPQTKKFTDQNIIERDESITLGRESIINKFTELKLTIDNIDDVHIVKELLDNIKEEIFEFTGGHKILYEISKYIKDLAENVALTPEVKTKIKEKITFWINKL